MAQQRWLHQAAHKPMSDRVHTPNQWLSTGYYLEALLFVAIMSQISHDVSLSFPFVLRGKIVRSFRYMPLQWRHNYHDGVSIHQPHGCLLNRLFGRRSKKISKLRVTGLCVGNSPGPVNSPHKGPVTRKMFPFDDVIRSSVSDLELSI